MAESKARRGRQAASPKNQDTWLAEVQDLSFNEARTALELAMAKLQSSELEVEQMADLYRRAEAYADRCQAVLKTVEQNVIEWETTAS